MKSIKVGNQEIFVRPSALTPHLFKRMTNKDLLVFLGDKSVTNDEKLDGLLKLFFIMQMQASTTDIKQEFEKASDEANYYEFLDKMNSDVMFDKDVIAQIVKVYSETNIQTSKAKN